MSATSSAGALWIHLAGAPLGIVAAGSVGKFRADEGIGHYLRSTKERVPAEASPLDRIWGVGLAADDPHAQDPTQWRGLNLLGFALMEAREELSRQYPSP